MLEDQSSTVEPPASSDPNTDRALYDRVKLLRNCGLSRAEVVKAIPGLAPHRLRRLFTRVEEAHPRADQRSRDVNVPEPAPEPKGARRTNPTGHGALERDRRAALKARTDAILAPINGELEQRRRACQAKLDALEVPEALSWLEEHAQRRQAEVSAAERSASRLHAEQLRRDLEQLQGREPPVEVDPDE